MNKSYKTLFLIFFAFSSILVKAQDIKDTIEVQRNVNGKINFARFKINPINTTKNASVFFKNLLQLKQDDELRLIKESKDDLGISHNKYQQFYKGIKVENSEFLLHSKNGIIETANGEFNEVNITSVKLSLVEKDALAKALNFVGAKKYKWQDSASENFIKQSTNNQRATYFPKGELVIQRDYLHKNKDFKLAWKFMIASLEPFNEQLIFVDAKNGNIVANIPLVLNENVGCEGPLRYSGLHGFMGDSYSGGVRLSELRYNVTVSTRNLRRTYDYANATEFHNNDIHFTQTTWPTFAQDQPALDAHWGAEMVLDYWKVVFGRNSINGNGLPILSYVHAGNNWENAGWVGGSNLMQYGDGGVQFRPLTSLDVCAHEFGHGICQYTANLLYQGESGALNEGFSDIWGASVEHWAAPDKQTWLMGEEITLQAIALRSLQNPNQFNQPDTYLGTNWASTASPSQSNDYGGVHTNSGVLNYWYFLISQGGNGTNDIRNNFSVNAIGIDHAQRIAYKAESVYLTSSANFATTRTATIQAARDLYGVNSCDEIAVINAWYAVGVGAKYTGDGNLTVSGNSDFCTSATYTVNAPAGSTVAWSATSGIVNINATTGYATRVSDGSALITASVATCQGQRAVVTPTKRVSVGIPNNYYIQRMSMGSTNRLDIYPSFSGYQLSVTSWNVYVDGSFSTSGSGYPPSVISVYASSGSHSITLTTYNSCGSYSTSSSYSGYSYYSLTPNPANGNVTITDKAANSKSALTGAKVTITVFDNTNRPLKQFTFSQNSRYNFSVANLTPGIYTVQIKQNGSINSLKLIKQ